MDIIGIVGIDGAGKSSFSNALAAKLEDEVDGCIGIHQLRIPGYEGYGNRTTHTLGRLYKRLADFGHRFSIPQEPGQERFDLGKGIVSSAYKLTALLYNNFIQHHRKKTGTVLVERALPVDAIVYADEYDGVDGLRATTDYMFDHIPEWPKAIIWVRPKSVEAAYRRIRDRAENLGTRLEIHETKEKLKKASEKYQQVLDYLSKRYKDQMPIFEVVSDVEPPKMADRLMESGFGKFFSEMTHGYQYQPMTATASPQ